jgi:flavodoxin I
MSKIGIFFGTETGTTRLIAKKIYTRLGDDIAAKPVNVNRTAPADMLQYDALILGTPSYGVGQIPGHTAGCLESNWEEFLAKMPQADFSGKRIAMFGLGAQERYTFEHSASVIDQRTQGMHTDARLDAWVAQVRPLLLARLGQTEPL